MDHLLTWLKSWLKTKPDNWFGVRIVYYENKHGLTVELGRAAAQKG